VLFFIDLARPDNPLGYNPLETKKYVHDLELYGGKANVMAAEFREWFAGLWYGRNLAYTTAVISVLLTGVVRLAYALREPPEEPVPGAPSPSPNRPGAAWPPDALPRSAKRDAFRPGRSDPSTPPGPER